MTPCQRCTSPLEHGDLRCAVCALPTLVAAQPVDAARVAILRCTECGAAVGFDAGAQAPCCGFCGAVMAVEQPVDPVEVAQFMVPFAVERGAAEASLRGWLGKRGYFAPASLSNEAVFESLVPLCWAGWLVNAQAMVAWTADSDADSHRSAWAPHAGTVPLAFRDIVIPASRGLRHDECRLLTPYYNLAPAVAAGAQPGVMIGPGASERAGVMIESFDAQRSAARRQVNDAIEATARVRVEPHIPGRRFRNVRVSCMLQSQTNDRIALPAWVLAYRFHGTPYRAIVHGQRPEVVFGTSPTDWWKVIRTVGLGLAIVAAIIAVIVLATGCSGPRQHIDAPDFGDHCTPSGSFPSLTGREAVQGLLNVHVDAGGLIKVDTQSELLLVLDLVQTGTDLAVIGQICSLHVPDVPLAGQDMPIQFQIPQGTLDSIGTVTGSATLSSPDQTCADFQTQPITVVLGALLDPASRESAPLPFADDTGVFTACQPAADTPCATATGTACACDQEADGNPGATLVAHNVPALDLDQVYVTLRTTFSLKGQVWSPALVKGAVDATLDTGVLACKLIGGTACSLTNLKTVKALNPVVTPQDGNPSTFQAVRIDATTSCADVIANKDTLFPR